MSAMIGSRICADIIRKQNEGIVRCKYARLEQGYQTKIGQNGFQRSCRQTRTCLLDTDMYQRET